MNKKELEEHRRLLIELCKDYKQKIDKAIKYLKLFDDNSTLIDHSIIKGALNILGDKENE